VEVIGTARAMRWRNSTTLNHSRYDSIADSAASSGVVICSCRGSHAMNLSNHSGFKCENFTERVSKRMRQLARAEVLAP